ncbi:DUF4156 domain-containing protein [Photobacterium sagamiensis]|uniref:DUF4156 domain-containing protein n=1 Tax=Photobacterium sagamiensis TaxID=2910241 RepID=UPI003D14F840
MKKDLMIVLVSLFLFGCETTRLNNESKEIQVVWNNSEKISHCTPKETIISSEGHWYTYLFIGNLELTEGALNALKNRASALGANTIDLYAPRTFATSVTLMGNAYVCPSSP